MSHGHLNRAFSWVGVTQLEELGITLGFLSAVVLLLTELRRPPGGVGNGSALKVNWFLLLETTRSLSSHQHVN